MTQPFRARLYAALLWLSALPVFGQGTLVYTSHPVITKGVKYQSIWSGSTAYSANDLVLYNGVFYLALVGNTGQTPATGVYWQAFGSGTGSGSTAISIGTVTQGAAAASLTSDGNGGYKLNLTLPQGAQGVAGATPAFSIGTVSTGTAAVAIDPSSTATNVKLNFTLPQGTSSGTTDAGAITSGILDAARTPAFTGDATKPAGSATLIVNSANGRKFAQSATSDTAQGTVIYEKNYWTDLSEFIVTGTTPTINNGQIVWNATNNGNFVNSIALANTSNNDDDIDMEVTFTLGSGTWGTGTTSSNFGLGAGKLASNITGNQWGAAAFYNTYFSPAHLQTFLVTGTGGSTPAQVGADVAVGTGGEGSGQQLTLVYSQRGPRFYSYVRDVTQAARVNNSYDMVLSNCNAQFPNSDRMAIWNNGGSFTIQSIRVISRKRQQADVAVLGDSKSFGCDAGVRELRYGAQISKLGVVSVFAGSGDTTQSILNDLPYALATKPKAVLLNIGRNDLAQGIAAATWQANYSSIVAQLKAAGVRVVHLLPIPETSQNQAALSSYIASTFSTDPLIDPGAGTYTVNGAVAYTATSGWSNATMLAADNIHPNAAGHAYLASLLTGSGSFPMLSPSIAQHAVTSEALYPAGSSANAAAFNGGTVANPITAPEFSTSGGVDIGIDGTNYNYVSASKTTDASQRIGFAGKAGDPNNYILAALGGYIVPKVGGVVLPDGALRILAGNLDSAHTGYTSFQGCNSSCTVNGTASIVFATITGGGTVTLPTSETQASNTSGLTRIVTVNAFSGVSGSQTVVPPSGYTLYTQSGAAASYVIANGHSATFASLVSGGYFNWLLVSSN